jgi:cytochrome c peroxidase
MRYISIVLVIVFSGLFILKKDFTQEENYAPIAEDSFINVDAYIQKHLSIAVTTLKELSDAKTNEHRIALFKTSRLAFKKAEPFAAYISPENTLRVNGPPLPVFKEDNKKILPSIGYQAIEEIVYGTNPNLEDLKYQVEIATGYLIRIAEQTKEFPINANRFFPSVHQQFLRIYALGLTGFDTPISLNGIEESLECFKSIAEVYSISIEETIKDVDSNLNTDFKNNINKTLDYLRINSDFNTFDRYHFGRMFLNKLTKNWSAIAKAYGYIENRPLALNIEAPTFFEEDSFNLDFFRSAITRNPSNSKIELGELLFKEKSLSASGTMSCVTCHDPNKAYQDGLTTAIGESDILLSRNTPTLINSIYQKKFFWDGRVDELEHQIANVFDNKDEFNNSVHSIKTSKVLNDKEYLKRFQAVFPNKTPSRVHIVRALAAYVSTLNAMNSRFDRNMRGETSDFTTEEKLGMNLYMGKALCATCHFIPLTNGTVPPLFMDTEKEIIGVPATAENQEVDEDLGFYSIYKTGIHKFMFKTPTIRNAELTAPYMHNGVYSSLEEVMDFYNKGGGNGLGFELDHQTLPFENLNLTEKEIKAIISFMKTFTDTDI